MAAKKKKPAPSEPYAPPEEPPKPKAKDLPGMVGDGVSKPQIPALDDAVREYVHYRDLRITNGTEEKLKKKLVLALMENNKPPLASYEVDDLVVVKKPKDDTASIKVVSKADYVGEPHGDDSDE
jgi:hypothetical protein